MKEINLDKEIEQAQQLLDELLERKSKRRAELQSDLVDQINALAEKIGLNEQFSLKVINRTALYHGEAYPKVSMIKLISSVTGNVYQTFDVEDYSTEETIERIKNVLGRNLDRYKLIDQIIESITDLESVEHKSRCNRLILQDGRIIKLDFSLHKDAVEVSASKRIARDSLMIVIKLDDDLVLAVEDNSFWREKDLIASIESKPIKCDLTFDSMHSAVERSLMQIDKIDDIDNFQLLKERK